MEENIIILRIKSLMDHFNLSSSQFADIIRMDRSGFSKRMNGHVAIGDAVINKIVLALSVNKDWLLNGVEPMLIPNLNNAQSKNIENFVNIPLITVRAKAGYLTGFGDMEYIEMLPTFPVIVDRTYKGKYRCFEVEGDSMDDGTRNAICDRDIILGRDIKRDLWKSKLHIKDWDFIIVHMDGITVKRIIEHDTDNGVIKCHSTNPLYDDFILNLDQIIELYNVIKIVDRNARR